MIIKKLVEYPKGQRNNITSLLYSEKNYLQLFYRVIKEILLYQGFPRPILPKKHLERREGMGHFVEPVVKKNF